MTSVDVITMEDLMKEDIDGYLPFLVEIYNPDISWNDEEKDILQQEDCYLRLISDELKVKYNGHTWLPCAFNYTPPEMDGAKIGNASISISAIDYRVKGLLRTIRIPSEIKVIAMFTKVQKDDNAEAFVYKFVKLNTVTYTAPTASSNNTSITFNLCYETALSNNIPADVATEDRVPSSDGGRT